MSEHAKKLVVDEGYTTSKHLQDIADKVNADILAEKKKKLEDEVASIVKDATVIAAAGGYKLKTSMKEGHYNILKSHPHQFKIVNEEGYDPEFHGDAKLSVTMSWQ